MSDETQKIYLDKEKFVGNILRDRKNNLLENIDKLPNEELPFMEPHLRALYFETYFLLAKGFYNASLVLMGILLENVIKEKLFMEGTKDEELEKINFGVALNKIKLFISDEEFKFLDDRKLRLRNPYAHYNKMKLSEGIYFPAWTIENPVQKLIALQERVNKGELTEAQARQELIKGVEPELMSSKEFRPISQIAKSEKEKSQVTDVFLEIDGFIREFAEKYFKPKN